MHVGYTESNVMQPCDIPYGIAKQLHLQFINNSNKWIIKAWHLDIFPFRYQSPLHIYRLTWLTGEFQHDDYKGMIMNDRGHITASFSISYYKAAHSISSAKRKNNCQYELWRRQRRHRAFHDRLRTCETVMTASLSCHGDVKMKRNKVDNDISMIGNYHE